MDAVRRHLQHPMPLTAVPTAKQVTTRHRYMSGAITNQTDNRLVTIGPALQHGSRSHMCPTLVALTPMSKLLTSGDRA
jgi:hypothetical protein